MTNGKPISKVDRRGIPFTPIRSLPPMRHLQSPQVVLTLDRIRRATEDRPGYEEFSNFALEYPRCYQLHLDCADFRLQTIHRLLDTTHKQLIENILAHEGGLGETAVGNRDVKQIYWDFESYLSEICISLDLLARVVGPAFRSNAPLSFNKLSKFEEGHPIADHFRIAKNQWVNRLKDYRDCFTHYTPVDRMLWISLFPRSDGWELYARLPVNPNIREIMGFRFDRRTELLRYAIAVHRKMTAFDRKIARTIWRLYQEGQFPIRTDNLFFVGQRFRN
jgi:hypothetical protein